MKTNFFNFTLEILEDEIGEMGCENSQKPIARFCISSFFTKTSSQSVGIASKPYIKPVNPPVTAAVVSVSKPKFTAFKTASL